MSTLTQRFLRDELGATAIEYGLIAALVAVGCITAFIAFGGGLTGLFTWVNSKASGAFGG